jgi:non-ribosomal peptide synthetase component E (peptide arylation enzyme)
MRGLDVSPVLVPARVELVEELPLTAAGKADKKVLREWAAVAASPAKEGSR